MRLVRLLCRTAGWALVLPALKRVLSLQVMARLMWHSPRLPGRDPVREEQIVALLDRVYRHGRVPRPHNCLERSLIMYRYLSELNASPSLVVALGRESDRVRGHAWVVVDGRPLGEHTDPLRSFEPFAVFGPAGVVQGSGTPGPQRSRR